MTENYTYDSYGNLATIKIGGQRVWELSSYNGTYRTVKLGETPLTLSKSYSSSSGVLSSATISNSSGPLHIFSYTFDGSGNLTNRYGMTNGNETFSYDEFDRLKTGVSYFINGNINSKSGIGSYTYDASKKHAVTQVANTNNLIQGAASLTYNAFNKVATVVQGTNTLTITYGPDRQRTKTVLVNGSNTTTTLYADNYEQRTVNGTTTTYHYVASPDGLAAVYVKKNGTTIPYYVETDHLGSIINLFDASGTKQFSATYDAWGKQTITKNAMGLTRGYTGHEHWNVFGLIDMNGRFYDPLLGRFLSPDPYVQAPDNPQNFNRYAYCFNNPLKYTDPSGNISEFVAFLIFSTISNGLWQGVEASARDESFWSGFGKGAAIGAVSSVAGNYAGQLVSSAGFMGGFAGGFTGGFTGGFIAGYGNALINHSSDPLMQGIYGGLASGAIGGLAGGLNAMEYSNDLVFRKGCVELGVNSGDAVPATDEFLLAAQKSWYPDAPMGNVSVFTVENVPQDVQNSMDLNRAFASTHGENINDIFTGKSNVYFNKNNAFTSAKQLFITMGHEFVHVSQYAALAGQHVSLVNKSFVNVMEYWAYSFQAAKLGAQNNFTSFSRNDVLQMIDAWPEWFGKMSWSDFGWFNTINF
jgi:RHS repeat-associated protein